MFTPMVVDIYHGDVVTDLKATAAAGVRGIIHKASQGAGIGDDTYEVRRRLAKDAGLLWGAYHFANDEPVADQVENFLKWAAPDDDTLLALDFEPNKSNTMRIEQAREFLEMMFDKTGRRPVLYSGNLIKEELGRNIDPFFAQHRLWLCQYGPSAKLPATWSKYWLWQYTGDGVGPLPHTVPGIRGMIDLNVYDGTPEQLKAEWAAGPVAVVAETAPATAPGQAPAGAPPADATTTATAPAQPPLVVTTPTRGVTRSTVTRAPAPRSAPAPKPSPFFAFLTALLWIVAVLGILASIAGGAAAGYWAATTAMITLQPGPAAAAGAGLGLVAGLVVFGGLMVALATNAQVRRLADAVARSDA